MNHHTQSIRAFIGARNFEESRFFYRDLGFEEFIISPNMSYFQVGEKLGFYLQDYYVKDWIENLMVFLEVADVEQHWQAVLALGLPNKYPTVKLLPIVTNDWGREYFLHDPSGVLWHFGEFYEVSAKKDD
ncbi:MAG: glyoxalase [Bacteroidia bacterium]|nr:glyoxalase [Bacteroidia bacterium]